MIDLSIIIPIYNNWMFTQNVLTKFKSLPNNYEIIIIDNCSTDGTDKNIQSFLSDNVKYIRNSTNNYFGLASNQGYELSLGRNIMFLNNDIKILDVDFKWFDNFIKHVDNLSKPTLIGPTGGYIDIDNNFQFKYETDNPKDKINYMSGWCLTAKREVWQSFILKNEIGPFDSKSYKLYWEDSDIGFRAILQKVKFELYQLPLVHIGKQTSKNINMSELFLESKGKFANKWKKHIKELKKN